MSGKFHLAGTERSAATGVALPGQKKTDQLPKSIEPETAWHDRITRKMAVKKPQIFCDIELGVNLTFLTATAIGVNPGNTIHHEHVWRRQLCIVFPKHLTTGTAQELITVVAVLLFH